MTEHVRVISHAHWRALERFPAEFSRGAHADVCRAIAREVLAAIAEGRMATRLPRFACRRGTRMRFDSRWFRGRYQPSVRFVWTPDERRLYVVRRHRGFCEVLTVIRSPGQELASPQKASVRQEARDTGGAEHAPGFKPGRTAVAGQEAA